MRMSGQPVLTRLLRIDYSVWLLLHPRQLVLLVPLYFPCSLSAGQGEKHDWNVCPGSTWIILTANGGAEKPETPTMLFSLPILTIYAIDS